MAFTCAFSNGFSNGFAICTASGITYIQPAYACAGAGDLTVTIVGTGFTNVSSAAVNGSARTTVYVSATKLLMVVLAADMTRAALLAITVDARNTNYLTVQLCGSPAAGKGPVVRPNFDHLADLRANDTGGTLRDLAGIRYLAGRSERW